MASIKSPGNSATSATGGGSLLKPSGGEHSQAPASALGVKPFPVKDREPHPGASGKSPTVGPKSGTTVKSLSSRSAARTMRQK